MFPEVPAAAQLAVVITQSTAPAFLLGAVVGLISVLLGRQERVLDRSRALNARPLETANLAELKADLPRLVQRASLLNSAVRFAICSGVTTTLLIMFGFVLALFGFAHERGVAGLFVLSVGLFGYALIQFLREINISLRKVDHF